MRKPIDVGKPWEKKVQWSLAVATEGRLLHTSGITARDREGNLVGAGDMRAQILQVLRNLDDVLKAAGVGFDKVVKYTMYTTDIDAFMKESAGWLPYFVDRPASTLVEVRRLVHPDMLVEIEVVAALGA